MKSWLPRTLFGRLLLVFLAFGAVMTLALLTVMQGTHRLYHLEADQLVNRSLATTYVQNNFLLGEVPLTGATLHKGLARLASANPDVDIYLIDDRGGIVAASVPERDWRLRSIALEPIKQMLGGTNLPILGDNPRERDRKEIFSAVEVSILQCPARYLYVVLRATDRATGATQLRAEFALGEGVGVVLLASLLAVALSLFIMRHLTRRLSSLDQAMTNFELAHSNAAVASLPSDSKAGDEIDRLTSVFQRLATQVEDQMGALRSTDAMRREVLANVSHDLRTPLSTLRAHLEALALKGHGLTDAERREYEAVAMRQTKRLSRLIDQLIEAAKLDAAQIALEVEPFSLADLVQDVVQKFTLAAQQHGVHLCFNSPPDLPWVVADVALIERVLDNLIENALRHSPRDGLVTIDLALQGNRAQLAVTDSGPGLTPDQIPRVFERFYRADPSRSTDAGHTGLGLAIVKSILDLHGSTIEVDGRPGRGARFCFSLQLADSNDAGGSQGVHSAVAAR